MSYQQIKRFLDFSLSVVLLSILSPLLMVIAITIKLDSSGPILFLQKRLGRNSKEFQIYKFRSMCINAEKGGVYEKKDDKRVTKAGKILRTLSIDELPQLMNIAKGEMSIIGPRPTLTYHPWPIHQYTKEQKKRFRVRPGVTGWAQVNGRKDVPWKKRIQMDVEYVENLSFVMDCKIFLKTIYKVVSMQDNLNKDVTI